MEKMTYVVLAAAVLVVIAAGAVVYGSGVLNIGNGSTVGPSIDKGQNYTSPISAIQAMKVAENDTRVAGWKAGKQDVYLTRVSADSINNGISFLWTVTYGSSNEEISVRIMDVAVNSVNITARSNNNQFERIETAGMLDSDKASNIAIDYMTNDGNSPSGPGSCELWAGSQGTPVWEIRYPFEGGYYVFRVDAVSGQLIRGARFGAG